ncbi:unnamed protein product [Blepharisma stoltei]|uniref:Uncharacterized protein n=1 Tax=Blepharisma stoltei TaxID=1481888 RepID=A0AAU9IMU7_9CILI|nr:unnamed protein product [Blepharisma stoltei]
MDSSSESIDPESNVITSHEELHNEIENLPKLINQELQINKDVWKHYCEKHIRDAGQANIMLKERIKIADHNIDTDPKVVDLSHVCSSLKARVGKLERKSNKYNQQLVELSKRFEASKDSKNELLVALKVLKDQKQELYDRSNQIKHKISNEQPIKIIDGFHFSDNLKTKEKIEINKYESIINRIKTEIIETQTEVEKIRKNLSINSYFEIVEFYEQCVSSYFMKNAKHRKTIPSISQLLITQDSKLKYRSHTSTSLPSRESRTSRLTTAPSTVRSVTKSYEWNDFRKIPVKNIADFVYSKPEILKDLKHSIARKSKSKPVSSAYRSLCDFFQK